MELTLGFGFDDDPRTPTVGEPRELVLALLEPGAATGPADGTETILRTKFKE